MHYLPPWARKHFLTISFIAGFATDLILLNHVEDVLDNIILLFYVSLATSSMIVLYSATAEKFGELWSQRFRLVAPMAIQYSFGGLLSGMLIFYGRSGDWLASWPFFAIIGTIIIANELVRNRSQRLIFNLVSYFIGLFSYIVLIVPVFTGNFGPTAFLLSGVAALGIVFLLIKILRKLVPVFIKINLRIVIFSILMTYIGMNTLYFANIIPPIPLSLKEITIAHSVVRIGGTYELIYETTPRWQFWRRVHDTFHPSDTGQIVCFTRVFAPSRLTTEIYHVWEFKNADGRWQEHFRLSYPVTAVGDRGYRGYTLISNFHDGEWRCKVITPWGQMIGQQRFVVDSSVEPVLSRRAVE